MALTISCSKILGTNYKSRRIYRQELSTVQTLVQAIALKPDFERIVSLARHAKTWLRPFLDGNHNASSRAALASLEKWAGMNALDYDLSRAPPAHDVLLAYKTPIEWEDSRCQVFEPDAVCEHFTRNLDGGLLQNSDDAFMTGSFLIEELADPLQYSILRETPSSEYFYQLNWHNLLSLANDRQLDGDIITALLTANSNRDFAQHVLIGNSYRYGMNETIMSIDSDTRRMVLPIHQQDRQRWVAAIVDVTEENDGHHFNVQILDSLHDPDEVRTAEAFVEQSITTARPEAWTQLTFHFNRVIPVQQGDSTSCGLRVVNTLLSAMHAFLDNPLVYQETDDSSNECANEYRLECAGQLSANIRYHASMIPHQTCFFETSTIQRLTSECSY